VHPLSKVLLAAALTLLPVSAGRAQTMEPAPEPALPNVRVGGRIMTGYELERVHPEPTQAPVADGTEPGFFLDQARLSVEADLHDSLRAELSADFDNGVALRNAYVNWRPEKKAQLRVGRFKRPLSRLANESIGALPFRSRGLFDSLLLEDQQWGDRALGAMLHGKPNKRTRYHAALMSPAALGTGIEGADVIARFEYEPVSALKLGLGAAHKWTERFENGPNLSLNAASVDVAVEASGFYAAIEATAAQNPNPPALATRATPRTAMALGVIGYVGYYAQLAPELRVGPIGVFEWMDTDSTYGQDERVRGVLGASLTFQESRLRVMPQVEVVRPLGTVSARSEIAEENYYLLVSAEL
jgi:Phosphate-selective porin O and P